MCPILKYAMTYLYFFLLNFWWDFYFFFQMYYSQFKSSMLFHDPLNYYDMLLNPQKIVQISQVFPVSISSKTIYFNALFGKKLDIFTCLIGAQNMCTSASVFNIDVISRRLKPNIFSNFVR